MKSLVKKKTKEKTETKTKTALCCAKTSKAIPGCHD